MKLTVIPLSSSCTQIKLSPRVSVIRNVSTAKDVGYFGFHDLDLAIRFTEWLTRKGIGRYDFSADTGWCKPRRSKRLGTTWEVKVHRAPEWLVAAAVSRDLD